MTLNKMNLTDLDIYLKGLVKKEREVLRQILETIRHRREEVLRTKSTSEFESAFEQKIISKSKEVFEQRMTSRSKSIPGLKSFSGNDNFADRENIPRSHLAEKAVLRTDSEGTQDFTKISTTTRPSKKRVAIPAKTFSLPLWKRQAHAKQNCCQYKDPMTGRICGSRLFLQVDHKQPRWANGSNKPDNLQILCAGHNALKYRQEASITS